MEKGMEEPNNNYKYGIKSTFAQCLALAGACVLQIGVGVQLTCSTIIIGALSERNRDRLTITSDEASWFCSLVYLCTPVGSLLSSLVMNRLGHKKCMILTNLPYAVSQIAFFYAEDVQTLYACSILMGLSVGFSGGPFSAYIGEVCEPKLRGALMSATNVFCFAGSLILTVIYAVTKQWRLTLLVSVSIPIVNTAILLMTPDSPMWLLAKGKTEKAQRTLGKLRGWVSREKCLNEFQEMVVYTSVNNNETNAKTDEQETSSDYWNLLRPEVLRPFRLLLLFFFFANLLSGISYAPFLIDVFTKFDAPVNVEWTIAFSNGLAIVAGVLTVFSVRILGKRFLTLATAFICSLCYILIGLIGVYWTDPTQLLSWFMLILYLTATFSSSFGIMPIGWILLAEIFPMKSRNITCSVCSSLSFIIGFFMTKYFSAFSGLVGFYNTFTIFGAGGMIGCVYFYFCLPETENKTLQEISEFFK